MSKLTDEVRLTKEIIDEIITEEKRIQDMATEFQVAVPAAGSDAEELLICAHNARRRAAALETENLKLLAEIDELRAQLGKAVIGVEKLSHASIRVDSTMLRNMVRTPSATPTSKKDSK